MSNCRNCRLSYRSCSELSAKFYRACCAKCEHAIKEELVPSEICEACSFPRLRPDWLEPEDKK